MPIYSYHCKKCEHEWDEHRKIGDDAPKKCKKCNSKRTEKIMALSNFQLVGRNWEKKDGY
jgi:putative FmdB family regulatory protein